MTHEERAIEVLRKHRPRYDVRVCDMPFCKSIDLAIEALEKQIPKKPKLYQDYDEYPTARCSCGAYLGYAESEMHFCPNCGQALLWEVGAEEDDN